MLKEERGEKRLKKKKPENLIVHWKDSWREEVNRKRKLRGGAAVTEGAKGKQGNPGQPLFFIPLQVWKRKQHRV